MQVQEVVKDFVDYMFDVVTLPLDSDQILWRKYGQDFSQDLQEAGFAKVKAKQLFTQQVIPGLRQLLIENCEAPDDAYDDWYQWADQQRDR